MSGRRHIGFAAIVLMAALLATPALAQSITVPAGNTNTMSGPIGGAGDIVLDGGGTLVLSGANTYTGGTTICGTACGVAGGSSVLQIGVDTVGTPGAITSSAIGTGTLTFDGGTLQAGGNYTIANATQINATGATIDSNGYTLTYSGNIADAAGQSGSLLLKTTNGNVILSGTNTYSGGTTIVGVINFASGKVVVTNGSAFGTGTVTLQNVWIQTSGTSDVTFANNFKIDQSTSGSLLDAKGKTLTISGNITDGTGAGKLIIADTSFNFSQVVFLGANTYTGGTTISLGNLVLGDATHTASITGQVTNNAYFYIRNADTSAITALANNSETEFSGTTTAGTMTITNKGGVSFLNASSAGNATINNYFSNATNDNYTGSVTFGTFGGTDTSSAGNAKINNIHGYTAFNAATNAGTATIINTFSGNTVFNDQSSAAGATITNSDDGTTWFQLSSTAGNAVITNTSGGSTSFYNNATGGNAQFIADGTGYVDFSQSSGTNGDGRITAGSIAGSGFYYIGGGNTLVVGSNSLSTTVSGVIANLNPDPSCGCGAAGPANLEKTGSGTLTLSGANTYTGTTVVNGGLLQVDGSIASSSQTTVNAGGALSGAGTVGNTLIASGGILLAGNGTPGSRLTVAGNLAFQSGALYLVTVNTNAATSVNVSGTASLNGGVGVSVAPGSTVQKQYTIVSASGGRTGTFTSLAATGVPAGFAASLSYDATHAYLNFALDYGTRTDLNTNQKTIATTLQNFFDANGGINAAFVARSTNGLTQLAGQGATGSQQTTFGAMSQFMGLLTDPFAAGRDGGTGGASAVPFAEESASLADVARSGDARDAFASIPRKAPEQLAFDQRWNVWAAAFGGSQSTSGNAVLGSNNTTSSLYGTAVGADYRISPNTIVGFALAGGGTSFNVSGLGGGRSDLFQAGAFLRHNVGAAYITGALAYGWQDVTTDRTVTAAGIDRLRAEFNANAWSGRIEGGYRFIAPWTSGVGLTPYAAGQVTRFDLPAYAESVVSGNNNFALAYAAKSVTATRSELGLRTDKSFALPDGILTLRGRAAWAHDFNPDRTVAATFQALPGTSFVVGGARPAADSALTTASAEMKWLNGWSAAASFEGEFSSVTRSYAGKGMVRYAW